MIRQVVPAFAAIVMLANRLPAAEKPEPGDQAEAALELTPSEGDSVRKTTIHYLISLPENYNQQEKCPLIMFLHGIGEWGDDLSRVRRHGPPKIVASKNTTPFIIISPQSPKGQWWKVARLGKLLDHVLATTKADPQRVYLTGLSMGGFGTWGWLAAEPDRFAAAIPICGGGDPQNAARLVGVPIWAFHGAKDGTVKLQKSQEMVDAIKAAGGKKVKLTVYPNARHDSWTETYDNPKIYKWLLSHRRGENK